MLLMLLLFEKKKLENIRSSKNADCTECSNVLCFRERVSGAKKNRMFLEDALAEKRGRNEKFVQRQKRRNIRTLQNN